MGDESYLSYLFGDSKFSLKTSEFIKRLEEIEQEEREYKAVFTDLEDLERSIREAGYRPMEVRPYRTVRRRGYQSRYRTMEDFYGFDF